ncbi:putative IQ motif, EF-hand binding, BAG domain, BAG family molecular chaperone regulator/7/8 [Helianthus annuus]|nr:putative IQ motif, EF-hand binding, BAG domain, BAG family molecular chaperone regulator/7/8 [Helianthus annuus]
MATHHHNHHQCHCLPNPSPTPTTTCYCTMCYTTTTYYHPPPPPPPSNPLIHSISHHHHQHAPPQTHHTQHPNHYPPPQTHQKHHLFQQNIQENVEETETETPTVSSLIHRIAALESSLLRRRKHSPAPSSSSSTLRDAAARTIQTHFRAFLVRRSVTLRHLKHLACIKSALNRLKSSVSDKTHFDSRTLSRESLSLLIKLDSIQGSDPMIRDGKRAISRELIRFMEMLDEMCTESQVIAVKNVRFGKNGSKFVINERKFLENLKNQIKYVKEVDERFNLENPRKAGGVGQNRIGDLTKSQGKSQPKVKKNVSFDDNGNVYRLFKSSRNPVLSDGSGSSNGDDEEIEAEVEVEEIGVSSKETEVEEDESSEMSENEMDPRKNLRTRIHRTTEKKQPDQEDDDDEDDSFVFSAPLPAKMEY